MENAQLQEIRELHGQYRSYVAEVGDSMRDKKMPEPTEELFSLYEKNGNRLLYENVYFERRRFLAVFGLLAIWYRREEDIRKLEEVLEGICSEETWALPAHVDRKNEDWRRTVDLFAAETAQALAQISSMLEGCLREELAQKVRDAVVHRVLDSYMEHPKGYWKWERWYNNWVAVCGGSVGSAALYLLGGEPSRLQEILDRLYSVLPNYIEGMCDDGVCPEGVSYFTYGMEYYVGFARQLCEYSGGKTNLLDSEKVRRVARFQQRCFLPGGNTVSFSDGETAGRFRLGLTCYLSGTVEGVRIPDTARAMAFEDDSCYRFMACWQDDCWVREYLERAGGQEEPQIQDEWFTFYPDAQWAVWNRQGVGIALKGGHNGESHNHNDAGSFMVTAEGEVFLTDLGAGEYTRQYFAEETRYEILCNRSLGHNVPIVNGQEQQAGEVYRTGSFTSSRPGVVELEFAGAYADTPRFALKRCLEWTEETDEITIADEICGRDADSGEIFTMEENLVTQIEPSVISNRIILKGKKGVLEVEAPENSGSIRVIREVFRNHHGEDEDVWRLCWHAERNGAKSACIIRCRYEKHT